MNDTKHIKSIIDRYTPYTIRQPNKSRVHFYTNIPYIKIDITDEVHFPHRLWKIAQILNRHLKEFDDLRRGDVIVVPNIMSHGEKYRYLECEGLFIFNGTKILDLTRQDGSLIIANEMEYLNTLDSRLIPFEFHVPDQFPILYWFDIVTHSSYVPFDVEKWADQLEQNFVSSSTELPNISYSWFLHNDEKYFIVSYYMYIDFRDNKKSDSVQFMSDLKNTSNYLYYVYKTYGNPNDDEGEFLFIVKALKTDKNHMLMFC